MTDIVAVFFLIGIAALLTILLFIFKNKLIAIMGGVAWAVLALYNFNRFYNAGDPDAGITVWGFAWLCLLFTLLMWTSLFWFFKTTPEKKEVVKEEDYYERHEKNMERIRKRRPKPRSRWD
jgi:hypothetical protein